MTDECYWNYPLKGKDGKTENGSRKYRDYYFEKNGNVTNQEIADHFNVGISTIENHKSNYQYDKVLSDKKAYEQLKRQKQREEAYQKHLDDDNKNAKIALNVKYAQIEIAAMKVGIIPVNKPIPDELTFDKAWDTINRIGIDNLQKVIMRNFEEPAVINGTQHHTADINQTNLNFNIKSDDEVVDEHADTFTRFIERRMHTTNETTNTDNLQ